MPSRSADRVTSRQRSDGRDRRDDPGTAILAIVRRTEGLSAGERLRLGRWTSASLRDPRLAPAVAAAREHATRLLDEDRERRRRWESATRPLYQGLATAAGEDRRWRILMLAAHFVALLAILNLPAGLPPILAAIIVLGAPVSAWAAWGRGTSWLGAINATLAAAAGDRLPADEADALRGAWLSAVEADPPLPPPTLGAVGALLPSALLVVAYVVVLVVAVPR